MAYAPTRFVGPTLLTATPTPLYTFPSTAIMKEVLISNISNGLLSFSMWLVPNGSSYADQYKILGDIQIDGNTTVILDMSQVANPGESIYGYANVNSFINVSISGVLVQ